MTGCCDCGCGYDYDCGFETSSWKHESKVTPSGRNHCTQTQTGPSVSRGTLSEIPLTVSATASVKATVRRMIHENVPMQTGNEIEIGTETVTPSLWAMVNAMHRSHGCHERSTSHDAGEYGCVHVAHFQLGTLNRSGRRHCQQIHGCRCLLDPIHGQRA